LETLKDFTTEYLENEVLKLCNLGILVSIEKKIDLVMSILNTVNENPNEKEIIVKTEEKWNGNLHCVGLFISELFKRRGGN